jgi:hypothetical protein
VEHERHFLIVFWSCMGLGLAMRLTGAGDAGDFFLLIGLIVLIPYAVVNGVLTDPKDKKNRFPEC